MTKKEEIIRILAQSLRPAFAGLPPDLGRLEEIRLRVDKPVAVTWDSQVRFLAEGRQFCEAKKAHRVTMEEVRETMNYLSSYSRYAFEDKIRQGFLTIQGGHRVGLAGRVVLEAGTVKTISPITFLNIRIARQMPGCGVEVLPWLWRGNTMEMATHDTLLVSPPGLGKTTLLRDLIRLLSEQKVSVGVVDERSELAACYQGIPQNDLGPCTDVLDGCPKAEGMLMLVRTMAPRVIAVDEVGGSEDCQAVEYAMNCGCRILATAHGASWDELRTRPIFGRWMEERRFGRYVFIGRETDRASDGVNCAEEDPTAEPREKTTCCVYRVCDSDGKTLWTGGRMRPETACETLHGIPCVDGKRTEHRNRGETACG